ncbi:MAG: hypothetical protein DHS20C11_34100 [Lysobacteraceae bacterium]|nr:MAG: hypothetical protein DHS20C11_34100 [Xanthomonadaceae bacterium]
MSGLFAKALPAWSTGLLALAFSMVSPPACAEVVWRENLAHPDDIFGFGNQTNANSAFPSTFSGCSRVASDNGRYVVFVSAASNLVRDDTNHASDVFLRDLQTNQTRRISISNAGEQLDVDSAQPCMSADGRYVTYQTTADVTGESGHNGNDIFLYDRIENTTTLVSLPQDGCTSCSGDNRDPAISGDGNWIVFRSSSENLGFGNFGIYDQIMRYQRSTATFELISQNADGDTADNFCQTPTLSDDGRFVAFRSSADNLGPAVTVFTDNIYLYDTVLDSMILVSKSSDGTPADDDSYAPVMSGNGQTIVYASKATNLVANDTNDEVDIFVYRLGFESVERVSVTTDGTEGSLGTRFGYAQISTDGNKVAFISESPELAGLLDPIDYTVFVHDRLSGETSVVGDLTTNDAAGAFKRRAFLNGDGSIVWLITDQDDWVAGDSNGAMDAYAIDLDGSTAVRVSVPNRNFVGPSGANAPKDEHRARRWISADGRYVVFSTPANNLVPGAITYPEQDRVYLLDRLTRETTLIANGEEPTISADGRYIAFASEQSDLVMDDTNEVADIFVYDQTDASLVRASLSSLGEEANNESSLPYIAADGQHVVFLSSASNLTSASSGNIFVRDLALGSTTAIATGTGDDPSISADGRYVAFSSGSSDLVPDDSNGDKDVFVWDTILDIVRRVSVSTTNVEANNYSEYPMISDSGNYVVFVSFSTNLIDSVTSASGHIYLHEIGTGVTELVSINAVDEEADWFSTYGSVTDDGRYVVFNTGASNLAADDQVDNGRADFYLHRRDRVMGTTRRVDTDRFDTLAELGRESRLGLVSADGRFVLAISGYTDLHLDAGRYAQTDSPSNFQPNLIELSGFAEPTTISTIDLATLNAEVDVPVTIPIVVTGDSTPPLDGVASIDAVTGEVCLETDRMAVSGQPNARSFDCEMTFRSQGDHQLSLGYSVSESHQSGALLATITVVRPGGDPNQPPVAESQTLTVTPDTPRMINLLASDPDGDPLTFALLSPPSSGSLAGTPPNITYTPDPGFTGQDSFIFGVSDGLDNSGPATITLIVSDAPVPIADGQTVELEEDDSATIVLTGSASDGGGPLDYMVSSDPTFGMLMGTPPSLTYEPDPNAFGVDSFQFVVIDSTGTSDPATVTLIVDAVNDPPSFTGGPDLDYTAGTVGVQTISDWATDISPGPMEIDEVSFTLTTDDEPGVLDAISLSEDGTLEVTLSGAAGTARVEARAVDGDGAMSEPVVFEVRVDVVFNNGFG